MPTSPTAGPPIPTLRVFSGPLDPGGLTTYLFTLPQASTLQVMFSGVVAANPLRTLSPVLRLQLSRWNGTECVTVQQLDTAPSLTAAMQVFLDAGTYCVILSDRDVLTESVGATLRLVWPAIVTAGGTAGTAEFSTAVPVGGAATRTFVASVRGTVSLTLTSLSQAGSVGLGLGLVPPNGSGCLYSIIVPTTPGSPQLTTTVDPGDYCAGVVDTGTLTGLTPFSMRITHP